MPVPPKDPKLRQRRNKATTKVKLRPVDSPAREYSPLPRRVVDGKVLKWHALTVAWWKSSWASPMAHEWMDADIPGLFLLADVIDAYWRTREHKLLAEIRHHRQCFGLTPLDRLRLQWEIDRGEEAAAKRRRVAEPRKAGRKVDPRMTLVS